MRHIITPTQLNSARSSTLLAHLYDFYWRHISISAHMNWIRTYRDYLLVQAASWNLLVCLVMERLLAEWLTNIGSPRQALEVQAQLKELIKQKALAESGLHDVKKIKAAATQMEPAILREIQGYFCRVNNIDPDSCDLAAARLMECSPPQFWAYVQIKTSPDGVWFLTCSAGAGQRRKAFFPGCTIKSEEVQCCLKSILTVMSHLANQYEPLNQTRRRRMQTHIRPLAKPRPVRIGQFKNPLDEFPGPIRDRIKLFALVILRATPPTEADCLYAPEFWVNHNLISSKSRDNLRSMLHMEGLQVFVESFLGCRVGDIASSWAAEQLEYIMKYRESEIGRREIDGDYGRLLRRLVDGVPASESAECERALDWYCKTVGPKALRAQMTASRVRQLVGDAAHPAVRMAQAIELLLKRQTS